MRHRIFVTLLIVVNSTVSYGFTLLSGPNEATLPVSPDRPEIIFYWDGSTPPIQKKDEYDGGRYKDLDDEELTHVLLNEAFGVWNNVKGSYLHMKVERDADIEIDQNDRRNAIVVKSNNNLSTAAFAVPLLSDDGDNIVDCDITIGKKSVTAKNLVYILAHEIGHCVGLGHNHSNRRALMGYTRTDRNLYLSNDDRAGIIYLYMDPAFDSERKEFLGCAVVDAHSSSLLGLIFILLAPLGLAFVNRFRN